MTEWNLINLLAEIIWDLQQKWKQETDTHFFLILTLLQFFKSVFFPLFFHYKKKIQPSDKLKDKSIFLINHNELNF